MNDRLPHLSLATRCDATTQRERLRRLAGELDGPLVVIANRAPYVHVNPYDLREVAGAIARAVRMPAGERAARLRLLRRALERNTATDWAVNQLADLARVREERRARWNAEDDERSVETRA